MPKLPRIPHATIAEVAAQAGVATRTVTRAFRNPELVNKTTRQRIFDIADKLGYRPTTAARRLANGRAFLIGVFIYGHESLLAEGSSHWDCLRGVEQTCIELQLDMLILRSLSQVPKGLPIPKDADSLQVASGSLYGGRSDSVHLVDGWVLLGNAVKEEDLQRMTVEDVPFVCVGRQAVRGGSVYRIGTDYAQAYAFALEELCRLGHRHILYVGADESHSDHSKLMGVRKAEHSLCIRIDRCLTQHAENPEVILEHLTSQPDRPTALLFGCEGTPIRLLEAITDNGLRIPKDLSVITCNGEKKAYAGVALAEVRIDLRMVGVRAVNMLQRAIHLRPPIDRAKEQYVAARYTSGESVAAPPQVPAAEKWW